MTTAEILREARALYASNPSHAAALEPLTPGSHCPVTALRDAAGTRLGSVYGSPYLLLCEAAGDPGSLVDWNAEHTTEQVLAAFDAAIEATS